MSEKPGRREQKRLETRDALVREAYRLFIEKGFETTTAEEIADAAEVSRRTFFRYFATKEAVVFAHHDDRLNEFLEVLKLQSHEVSAVERLKAAFRVLSATIIEDQEELLRQQRLVGHSPTLIAYEATLDKQWEHAVARMLDAHYPEVDQPSFEARIIAGALIGGMRAAMREWRDRQGKEDLLELGLRAIGLIESGKLFEQAIDT